MVSAPAIDMSSRAHLALRRASARARRLGRARCIAAPRASAHRDFLVAPFARAARAVSWRARRLCARRVRLLFFCAHRLALPTPARARASPQFSFCACFSMRAAAASLSSPARTHAHKRAHAAACTPPFRACPRVRRRRRRLLMSSFKRARAGRRRCRQGRGRTWCSSHGAVIARGTFLALFVHPPSRVASARRAFISPRLPHTSAFYTTLRLPYRARSARLEEDEKMEGRAWRRFSTSMYLHERGGARGQACLRFSCRWRARSVRARAHGDGDGSSRLDAMVSAGGHGAGDGRAAEGHMKEEEGRRQEDRRRGGGEDRASGQNDAQHFSCCRPSSAVPYSIYLYCTYHLYLVVFLDCARLHVCTPVPCCCISSSHSKTCSCSPFFMFLSRCTYTPCFLPALLSTYVLAAANVSSFFSMLLYSNVISASCRRTACRCAHKRFSRRRRAVPPHKLISF